MCCGVPSAAVLLTTARNWAQLVRVGASRLRVSALGTEDTVSAADGLLALVDCTDLPDFLGGACVLINPAVGKA